MLKREVGDVIKCSRCGCEVDADEKHDYYGKILCEDCFLEALQPPKPCDPMAVQIATNTRLQLNQKGTEGLTAQQKKIYDYIKEKGKVTREELATAMDLPPWELEKQFAVLRHCQLVRGFKEGNQVYLTLMQAES